MQKIDTPKRRKFEREYDLSVSVEGIGKLVPILKDKHGNIIDGFHRIAIDPDWFSIIIEEIDDPVKLELARLAVNFCRRKVSKEEMREKIKFLIVQGGLSPEDISRITGISISTVYRYMPKELKDQLRSKRISEGKKRSKLTNVKFSTDKSSSEISDSPATTVEDFFRRYRDALAKHSSEFRDNWDNSKLAIYFFKKLLEEGKVSCPICGCRRVRWECGHEF